MNQTFDWWLNGVPVIIPQAPGDFSEWVNGVPVVDLGASLTSFTGSGISSASAALGGKISTQASGVGISAASVTLASLVAIPGSGFGVAAASAAIGAFVAVPATGSGIASASAILSAFVLASVSGSGTGLSVASAILSTFTPPVPGASRRASPRQSTFRHQDYAAHGFSYRRVASQQEIVRHLGD